MTIGRAARIDFSPMECAERLNGPHCPHLHLEYLRSSEMICCWCGQTWAQPHATDFDSHGTYRPMTTPVREGLG